MKTFLAKKKLMSIISESQVNNVKDVDIDELICEVRMRNFALQQQLRRQEEVVLNLAIALQKASEIVNSIVKHHNSELEEKDKKILSMTNTIKEKDECIQQQIDQLNHAENIVQQYEGDLEYQWDIIKRHEQEIKNLNRKLDNCYHSRSGTYN